MIKLKSWHYGQWLDRKYVITDGPLTRTGRLPQGTNLIATVWPISSGNHHKEHAALIAAAPTMYQKLADVVDFIWGELRENPGREDMDGSIMDRLVELQTDLLETLRKIQGDR